ncbi:CHAP domain-containing protein [Acinetobacter sp.]|uniref:CHAP domain-containing protein n=1 Tax=Acinetobacter sp. TaxID=472 RepID=UPI0031E2397A
MIHAHHHPAHVHVHTTEHQALHVQLRANARARHSKKDKQSEEDDLTVSSAHDRHHNAKKPTKDIDLHKFSKKLESISARHSTEKCAQHIRIALQVAGANVTQHPIAASDWGQTLEKNGYHKIKPAFDRPQEGDIYIIQRTGDHIYGHIAGYTGNGWFSDFRQKNYAVYKEKDVKYTYYRLES